MKLNEILKQSNYDDAIFSNNERQWLENRIVEREGKKGVELKVQCIVRNKEVKLTPEETIRQLYAYKLVTEYNYPIKQLRFEFPIYFGREAKRADIVVLDKDDSHTAYIIVEIKKLKAKDGKEQLKSYCHGTGAPMAIWTNGENIAYYHRKNPNYFEDIPAIPKAIETLEDILNLPFTMNDLVLNDKLKITGKSLKHLILEMEDEVLANAGVDVFEEVFKLIFAKLYDEKQSGNEPERSTRNLEFRNRGGSANQLKDKIQHLFDKANEEWSGVFDENAKINLTPTHLEICVSSLEGVKLFNSNLEIVDEAFEYLMSKSSKGEKGQYFTPRYVIDMCVRMLNPKPEEAVIDTAAGSSGFTVHSIFHVWRNILHKHQQPISHLFTAENKPRECEEYVQQKVFAIDFDEKAVRVSRTLNLIAGDGQTNVLHLNTLDYARWEQTTKQEEWIDTYNEGFKKLKKLQTVKGDYSRFNFDVLMANPPFAGDIKEGQILNRYELANKNGKSQSAVGRDILFIERNLNFLKPGGRMAVVLPQGRFNNGSDKYIREFIAEHCRILAVVGLHGNTFKPHTGTKTSVLFVQKWNDNAEIGPLCSYKEDYPIFFATQKMSAKDTSGELLYWSASVKDFFDKKHDPTRIYTVRSGEALTDLHFHPIVAHDLFHPGRFEYYDGIVEEEHPYGVMGIAEAFTEFAKKKDLVFLRSPFNEDLYKKTLKGLEVAEVRLSKIDLGDRYDAEYFYKNSLVIQRKLENRNSLPFYQFGDFVASAFYPAATELYQFGDIPFIRCVDCISYPFITNIQETKFERLPQNFVEEQKGIVTLNLGDIVITKVGTPCYASLIEDYDFVGLSRTVLGLKNIRNINPYYLLAFLRGKYGFGQLERQRELTIQYQLTLDRVKNILIYPATTDFQKNIEELMMRYKRIAKESTILYQETENKLLKFVGLDNWTPTANAISIKTIAESFDKTSRLDAEYYQPKYDELFSHISNFDTDVLDNLVYVFKSIEPGSNAYQLDGVPFFRVADLSKYGLSQPEVFLNKDDFDIKGLSPKKNTILLSKDGSVGIAYKVEENIDGITSGAILHLKIKDDRILPDYLCLVLNSLIVQLQAERDSGGSVIQHWKPGEIKQVVIPILPKEIQEELCAMIQESFSLQRDSKRLLNVAKYAVELAIEQDENVAENWLKENNFIQ